MKFYDILCRIWRSANAAVLAIGRLREQPPALPTALLIRFCWGISVLGRDRVRAPFVGGPWFSEREFRIAFLNRNTGQNFEKLSPQNKFINILKRKRERKEKKRRAWEREKT